MSESFENEFRVRMQTVIGEDNNGKITPLDEWCVAFENAMTGFTAQTARCMRSLNNDDENWDLRVLDIQHDLDHLADEYVAVFYLQSAIVALSMFGVRNMCRIKDNDRAAFQPQITDVQGLSDILGAGLKLVNYVLDRLALFDRKDKPDTVQTIERALDEDCLTLLWELSECLDDISEYAHIKFLANKKIHRDLLKHAQPNPAMVGDDIV